MYNFNWIIWILYNTLINKNFFSISLCSICK